MAHAEPWLSNRYAQNCSACHSPARRNLPTKDRRCTLACQGCHVNPSGGGLRNEYGVWNQQRWLRSTKSNFLNSKGTPAPMKFQKYGKQPHPFSKDSKTLAKRGESQADADAKTKAFKPLSKNDEIKWERMAKDGAPLVVSSKVTYNEEDHSRLDEQEYIQAGSRTEFMARVTQDDPYRIERERSVFGGGDFRYFYLDSKTTGDVDRELKTTLAMAFDVGVRVRPTKEKAQFVFEHRYLQYPVDESVNEQTSPEKVFSSSINRSAYLLIDDLPYASYIQYGLHRPQFGHYTADHSSLLNSILFVNSAVSPTFTDINPNSAFAVNKTLSFGASPNVPFFNIHWILPVDDINRLGTAPFSRDKGFAASFGGRFVTYGASIMLSWWSTKGPRVANGPELANDMIGITGGLNIKNLILNVDYSTVDREFAPGSSDSGGVLTLETKYRVWRETYGVFSYANSNIARNLKKGTATEIMAGVKTFITSGTEFELLVIKRDDRDDVLNRKASTDLLQGQVHLYF